MKTFCKHFRPTFALWCCTAIAISSAPANAQGFLEQLSAATDLETVYRIHEEFDLPRGLLTESSNRIRRRDLGAYVAKYGQPASNYLDGDLNLDGFVDLADISVLSANWGQRIYVPDPPFTAPSRNVDFRLDGFNQILVESDGPIEIAGIEVSSASGSLLPLDIEGESVRLQYREAEPFSHMYYNSSNLMSLGSLGSSVLLEDELPMPIEVLNGADDIVVKWFERNSHTVHQVGLTMLEPRPFELSDLLNARTPEQEETAYVSLNIHRGDFNLDGIVDTHDFDVLFRGESEIPLQPSLFSNAVVVADSLGSEGYQAMPADGQFVSNAPSTAITGCTISPCKLPNPLGVFVDAENELVIRGPDTGETVVISALQFNGYFGGPDGISFDSDGSAFELLYSDLEDDRFGVPLLILLSPGEKLAIGPGETVSTGVKLGRIYPERAANYSFAIEGSWNTFDGTVPSPFLGDADGDGSVTFTDFLKLSGRFGEETNDGFFGADFDGSGEVGFSDFLILSKYFGSGPQAASSGTVASVPEPEAFGVLLVGFAGLLSLRRQRKQKS